MTFRYPVDGRTSQAKCANPAGVVPPPTPPVTMLTLSLQHFDGSAPATFGADDIPTVLWTLNGAISAAVPPTVFGPTGAHMPTNVSSATATGFALDPTQPWTYEVWGNGETTGKNAAGGPMELVDIAALNVVASLNVVPSPINTFAFTIRDSIGNVIATMAGAVVTNAASFHRAIVYDGSFYDAYVNGVRVAHIATAGIMGAPDTIRLRSSGTISTGNGWDEERLSQTARYTGASFTVPAAPFVVD